VGVAVKHRQLSCLVEVFIKHPPENSMAFFNFTSAVLDEDTTFILAPRSALLMVWVASTAT
jgi:hypothetical protein